MHKCRSLNGFPGKVGNLQSKTSDGLTLTLKPLLVSGDRTVRQGSVSAAPAGMRQQEALTS